MKKNIFKLITCFLCFGIVFSFAFVCADDELIYDTASSEEKVVRGLSNTILSAIMWVACVIIIGTIIFIGIKYLISGVDEKADFKYVAPKLVLGVVLVLLCVTIASFVANISGNDPAEDVIGKGEEAGEYFDKEDVEGKDEDVVIGNVSNDFLNIMLWSGYVVIFGMILYIGIKYLMSGANERANLKGIIPKTLIGVFFIVSCFSIAKFISDTAGNDKAEEIIKVGEEGGSQFEGSKYDDCEHTWLEDKKRFMAYTMKTGEDNITRHYIEWLYNCSKCGAYTTKAIEYSYDEVHVLLELYRQK